MKKRARWLLAVVLTVAMTMSCMPAVSAAGSSKKAKVAMPDFGIWGLNVDLSGVPAQVQAAVDYMTAQGIEPMEKETDEFLAEVVEEASGISFGAVKTSLGLALLQSTMGTLDTSRFNLGQEEFNRVMKEVLTDYFLTDLAYSCNVEDGIVTGIRFMSASDASSYRRMFTASDLWSMYAAPMSSYTMTSSQVENDPEGGDTTEITVQVKWEDEDASKRPDTVTVRLNSSDKSDTNLYYYTFETVTDGQAIIVVPNKDGDGNVIDYKISEDGVDENHKLAGKDDATYTVIYDQEKYTVTNTTAESGEGYTAEFVPVRNDKYVDDSWNEVDEADAPQTLIYDPSNTEQPISQGSKKSIDFDLAYVELTPRAGGEKITIPAEEATLQIRYNLNDQIEFASYDALFGVCLAQTAKDPSNPTDVEMEAAKSTAALASRVKYYQVEYDGVTYGGEAGALDENGMCMEINYAAEGRMDVDALSMPIHWQQMLAFTRDYAQHFGVAGDFWTSKDTDDNPYGAFKTQLDSYPDDYIPSGIMDYYMENMTLAYMADEVQYGNLLNQRIADCLAKIDEETYGKMTAVQKYLVIHDWMANNCLFDMGLMSDMMAGVEGANPTPSQMTAFGALLYDVIPDPRKTDEKGKITGTLDGCICLGYASTYALLIQHAFPEVYQDSDGNWLNQEDVGDNDIVDLVQIRFFGNMKDISVSPEFGGAEDGKERYFNSVHYYNAVKVNGKWYCVDAAYDDVNPEVMSQCRVETDGNISHKYFMIAPTNMLKMFDGRFDYIDCLYDGVTFERIWNEEEQKFESEQINQKDENDEGQTHYFWEQKNAPNEPTCDNDQYEATWFSGAVSEVTYDENYWYYITGPSMSYAEMMDMMNKMDGEDMDMSDQEDKPENKDQLVRRPRTEEGKIVPDEPKKQQGSSSTSDMEPYDDPYEEILFHYGYGSVLPGTSEEKGDYYGLIQVDEFYQDLYPDLVHGLGLYDGVLYFNMGNQIYTMTGANTTGTLSVNNEDFDMTLLKEYNDVYANSNGKKFTGMSFYAVEKDEDYAFHVFNRPIAAVSIEDKVTYSTVDYNGQKVIVRDEGVTPTLTVSIATNFSESNKDEEGNTYTLEALDYNPDYSMYNKKDEDEEPDPYENTNEEFLWCANVVDTMPMVDMLEDLNNPESEEEVVTVQAWCGQDGYTEQRTVKYGLSIEGTDSRTYLKEKDPELHHHYIYNEREDCYVCAHCNDSWHDYPPSYEDGYEEFPANATKGHTPPEGVKGDWYDTEDGEKGCKVSFTCTERHCGAEVKDAECDIKKTSATDEETGKLTNIYTATYYDHEIGTTLTKVCEHETLNQVAATDPTCTVDGNKAYYECADCGKIFVEDAEGNKTETTKADVTIKAEGHKWDNGKVTKEATCTVKGVKTYTCETCGETKTEEIATLAHQYGSDGKCTVCGAAKPAGGGSGGGGGGGGGREYDITVEKSAHGTVTPEWESAMKGDTVTLTVKPDKGYKLETLSVAGKGGSVVKVNEKNGVYSFDMPAYAVVVKATFVEDGPAVTNTFVDVKSDAYYYDAVLWAAQNGITGGKDDTHFAPNETCTRAQAVTFLWRAAGSPAPKSTVNPFVDMKPGAYYYDAVLWAVENGITKGTTDTTFSPNATCSRAQIVTFLWRSQKSPAAGTVNPFTDVAAGTYYHNAVLWAVKNGITGGTTATTFSPNNNCTRAQIVTFLYRNVNG